MNLFATLTTNQAQFTLAGFMLVGVMVGSWLTLKPKQFMQILLIDKADDISMIIVQIIGQLLLGMIIAPMMFRFWQWLYF
ncbi:MAG: hypothetical protein AAF846_19990 [Chloroflexota bacterium]